MGVVVGAQVFKLRLPAEAKYEGVEVSAKGLTVGEALEFGEFLDGLVISPVMSLADVERRDATYTLFASRVVQWNLESAPGVPLPATMEGMNMLDWTWGRDLVRAWIQAVTGVPDPLDEPLTSGSPSPVASVPMEPWLENHGTSQEPEPSSNSANNSAASLAS